MKSEVVRTKVIFRKAKSNGEITAIFPTLPGTSDPCSLLCYVHAGQHGSAFLEWIRKDTKPATPEEYAALKRELEGIGYMLDVRRKSTRANYLERLKATH